MALSIGIVGLPNAGKSSLFNALSRAGAPVAAYPFTTIDPYRGVVPVPDPRVDAIASVTHPERIVPATVEFVDIAGLVRGASRGEGLGNQFLAQIRDADAIAHVVRCFPDPEVPHVEGAVDPVRSTLRWWRCRRSWRRRLRSCRRLRPQRSCRPTGWRPPGCCD